MYWLRGLKFSSGVISNTHGYSDCGGEYWRVCIYYSCGQYSHSTYVIVGNSSCGYMTNTAGPNEYITFVFSCNQKSCLVSFWQFPFLAF